MGSDVSDSVLTKQFRLNIAVEDKMVSVSVLGKILIKQEMG